MQTIVDILERRLGPLLAELAGDPGALPLVRPAQDPRFGDYQANGVMALAKRLQLNPRQLAQRLVAQLDVADLCEPPEIAGPGFINFRLKPDWLAERLLEVARDEKRLGIDPWPDPPLTVVDFSGPNIAKQMHVGHLRSTIIGDVIARVLEFWYADETTPDGSPAKKVIRQNHVGDWGTQFGMLTSFLDCAGVDAAPLADVEEFYRRAQQRFDADPAFADLARQYVVRLQRGDPHVLENWRTIRGVSLNHCQEIYDRLGVRLARRHVRGESEYNQALPQVVGDLHAAGLLHESQGARCVFLDGFKTKEGEPLPLIVRKSDGAYLYATTDLAALCYRVRELHARRIIYVTDARQKLHFEMVFACARAAGWADGVQLEHVPFGSVLGTNGQPLKTRAGQNVQLKDLLDEAETRARAILEEKNPDLSEDRKGRIARAVGVAAVKYADLSSNLAGDYLFDWDRMLAMDGNTAPYLQYAYARVCSIFRKGRIDETALVAAAPPVRLAAPEELALAKLLLRYGETVEAVARDLRPHLLTTYLFELAQAFSAFYTRCPVLKADDAARSGRLLLCLLTARTLRHGLGLLGIDAIEQM